MAEKKKRANKKRKERKLKNAALEALEKVFDIDKKEFTPWAKGYANDVTHMQKQIIDAILQRKYYKNAKIVSDPGERAFATGPDIERMQEGAKRDLEKAKDQVAEYLNKKIKVANRVLEHMHNQDIIEDTGLIRRRVKVFDAALAAERRAQKLMGPEWFVDPETMVLTKVDLAGNVSRYASVEKRGPVGEILRRKEIPKMDNKVVQQYVQKNFYNWYENIKRLGGHKAISTLDFLGSDIYDQFANVFFRGSKLDHSTLQGTQALQTVDGTFFRNLPMSANDVDPFDVYTLDSEVWAEDEPGKWRKKTVANIIDEGHLKAIMPFGYNPKTKDWTMKFFSEDVTQVIEIMGLKDKYINTVQEQLNKIKLQFAEDIKNRKPVVNYELQALRARDLKEEGREILDNIRSETNKINSYKNRMLKLAIGAQQIADEQELISKRTDISDKEKARLIDEAAGDRYKLLVEDTDRLIRQANKERPVDLFTQYKQHIKNAAKSGMLSVNDLRVMNKLIRQHPGDERLFMRTPAELPGNVFEMSKAKSLAIFAFGQVGAAGSDRRLGSLQKLETIFDVLAGDYSYSIYGSERAYYSQQPEVIEQSDRFGQSKKESIANMFDENLNVVKQTSGQRISGQQAQIAQARQMINIIAGEKKISAPNVPASRFEYLALKDHKLLDRFTKGEIKIPGLSIEEVKANQELDEWLRENVTEWKKLHRQPSPVENMHLAISMGILEGEKVDGIDYLRPKDLVTVKEAVANRIAWNNLPENAYLRFSGDLSAYKSTGKYILDEGIDKNQYFGPGQEPRVVDTGKFKIYSLIDGDLSTINKDTWNVSAGKNQTEHFEPRHKVLLESEAADASKHVVNIDIANLDNNRLYSLIEQANEVLLPRVEKDTDQLVQNKLRSNWLYNKTTQKYTAPSHIVDQLLTTSELTEIGLGKEWVKASQIAAQTIAGRIGYGFKEQEMEDIAQSLAESVIRATREGTEIDETNLISERILSHFHRLRNSEESMGEHYVGSGESAAYRSGKIAVKQLLLDMEVSGVDRYDGDELFRRIANIKDILSTFEEDEVRPGWAKMGYLKKLKNLSSAELRGIIDDLINGRPVDDDSLRPASLEDALFVDKEGNELARKDFITEENLIGHEQRGRDIPEGTDLQRVIQELKNKGKPIKRELKYDTLKQLVKMLQTNKEWENVFQFIDEEGRAYTPLLTDSGELFARYNNRSVLITPDGKGKTRLVDISRINPKTEVRPVIQEATRTGTGYLKDLGGAFDPLVRMQSGSWLKIDPATVLRNTEELLSGKPGVVMDYETTGLLDSPNLQALEAAWQEVQYENGQLKLGDRQSILFKPTEATKKDINKLTQDTLNTGEILDEHVGQMVRSQKLLAEQMKKIDPLSKPYQSLSQIPKEEQALFSADTFYRLSNIAKYEDAAWGAKNTVYLDETYTVKKLLEDANKGLRLLEKEGISNLVAIKKLMQASQGRVVIGQNFASFDLAIEQITRSTAIKEAAERSLNTALKKGYDSRAQNLKDIIKHADNFELVNQTIDERLDKSRESYRQAKRSSRPEHIKGMRREYDFWQRFKQRVTPALDTQRQVVDTLVLSRYIRPGASHNIEAMVSRYFKPNSKIAQLFKEQGHTAIADVQVEAEVLGELLDRYQKKRPNMEIWQPGDVLGVVTQQGRGDIPLGDYEYLGDSKYSVRLKNLDTGEVVEPKFDTSMEVQRWLAQNTKPGVVNEQLLLEDTNRAMRRAIAGGASAIRSLEYYSDPGPEENLLAKPNKITQYTKRTGLSEDEVRRQILGHSNWSKAKARRDEVLNRLEELDTIVGQKVKDDPMPDEAWRREVAALKDEYIDNLDLADKALLQNQHLFTDEIERQRLYLGQSTPRQRRKMESLKGVLQSQGGQAIKVGLQRIENLLSSGQISGIDAGNMIKAMNQAIKEKLPTREAPWLREIGELYGPDKKPIGAIKVDISTPATVMRSLESMAQDIGLELYGDIMDESAQRSKAINEILIPSLKRRGLLKEEQFRLEDAASNIIHRKEAYGKEWKSALVEDWGRLANFDNNQVADLRGSIDKAINDQLELVMQKRAKQGLMPTVANYLIADVNTKARSMVESRYGNLPGLQYRLGSMTTEQDIETTIASIDNRGAPDVRGMSVYDLHDNYLIHQSKVQQLQQDILNLIPEGEFVNEKAVRQQIYNLQGNLYSVEQERNKYLTTLYNRTRPNVSTEQATQVTEAREAMRLLGQENPAVPTEDTIITKMNMSQSEPQMLGKDGRFKVRAFNITGQRLGNLTDQQLEDYLKSPDIGKHERERTIAWNYMQKERGYTGVNIITPEGARPLADLRYRHEGELEFIKGVQQVQPSPGETTLKAINESIKDRAEQAITEPVAGEGRSLFSRADEVFQGKGRLAAAITGGLAIAGWVVSQHTSNNPLVPERFEEHGHQAPVQRPPAPNFARRAYIQKDEGVGGANIRVRTNRSNISHEDAAEIIRGLTANHLPGAEVNVSLKDDTRAVTQDYMQNIVNQLLTNGYVHPEEV